MSWALLAVLIASRLANFWGLHYGNTDDITTDYARMTQPFWSVVHSYALSQSRIQYFVSVPLWEMVMRLAGTPWYDVVNLGTFALSVLLPAFALRRYYFPGNAFLLYAVALFAPLPLLFAYTPPYCNPLWMSFPLTACGAAVILFQQSESQCGGSAGKRWRLCAGAVATLLAVCAYESATVLSITILGIYFAASHAGRPWKSLPRRRDFQFAAGAIACFAGMYFAFRAAHPATYGGVQATTAYLSPPSVARVVGTLSLTSSVYAWFSMPQRAYNIDRDGGDAISLRAALSFDRATMPEVALAFLTAAVVFFWILYPGGKPRANPFQLALLAVVLLFAPNAAYPLTAKVASLVVNGQLLAYGATPYSQVGFACAFVALAAVSARLPAISLRIAAAALLAVFAGCGSLAASGFNRESAVFAREQAARWKVVRYLAACSAQIPYDDLQNVAAPRMWRTATASLSWGDAGQDELYWDVLAHSRYGAHIHLVAEPEDTPVHLLDFRLERDGSLQSVILARSDGKRFQEAWLIPAQAGAGWLGGAAIEPCGDGLQALHLAGDNLTLGAFTPIEPVRGGAARPNRAADLPALEPRSGRGLDQVYRVSLSPVDQGEAVRTVGLLINGMKSGVDGCYVFWDLATHEGRLVNDSGEDSKVMAPGGAIGNRQCQLLQAGTTYDSDGNTIRLSYHVKFRDTFKGLKQMFLFRKNTKGGNSGLHRMGWWWVE